ncbi:MAG: MarR family winged helix-turn-helix transcriptional regulator [Polyangiales bacterium]
MHIHVMDTETGIDPMAPMGCVGFKVRRASRALTSFYNERIRGAGIRITQWPVLAALRGAGALTVSQLAIELGTDQSTVSRSLQTLVRDGLVDLTEDGDARKRYARLTSRGLSTYNRAYVLWKDAQSEVLEILGPSWEGVEARLSALEAAVR